MRVRTGSRARLLDAGLALLSRGAVSGVEKLLSPEALQDATRSGVAADGGVSRHTAYRLWGTDRRQTVVDVADHVVQTYMEDASELFSRVMEAHARAVRDLESNGLSILEFGPDSVKPRFREISRLIFEWQLESTAVPASWALQSAALTSSRLWRGERPNTAQEETGQRILAARTGFYEAVMNRWVSVLSGILALWGRRPTESMTVEDLVKLMSGLFDGFLLRVFVDPDLNDPELPPAHGEERLTKTINLASDAIIDLVWAYTAEASVDDPRRPEGDEEAAAFDDAVAGAIAGPANWSTLVDGSDEVSLAHFPSRGDLADSALRRLVAPSGLDLGMSKFMNPAPLIELVLRRLKRATAAHPAITAVATSCQPTLPADAEPFLDQLTRVIASSLRSPRVVCPDPEATARSLVGLALDGDSGWIGIDAVLTVLGSPPFEA